MKKLFPIAMIAVVAMMFTSCKKDYTCTCKVSATGVPSTTAATPLGKQTKSDAKKSCDNLKTTAETNAKAAGLAGYSISCDI